MTLLHCADGVISVDESVIEMSRPRVHVDAFTAHHARGSPPLLLVKRVTSLDGQRIEGPLGACIARVNGETLEVEVEDGPFLGELVLRLAYSLVTTRLDGVLIHSAGLRVAQTGLLACGQSGDGKSTLSRLSRGAGVGLLSDEIIQVLPGSRLGATPFRSDVDNVGAPAMVAAKYFVTLRKADHEALESLDPLRAAQVAVAQCFEVAGTEFSAPRSELQRRLLRFLSGVELRTLAFRKHADVGDFVRQHLAK